MLKQLTEKEKDNYEWLGSFFCLLVGLVLLFIGIFVKPIGEIHYSVLTAFGEICTFVGCVWGIKYHYSTSYDRKNNKE